MRIVTIFFCGIQLVTVEYNNYMVEYITPTKEKNEIKIDLSITKMI